MPGQLLPAVNTDTWEPVLKYKYKNTNTDKNNNRTDDGHVRPEDL